MLQFKPILILYLQQGGSLVPLLPWQALPCAQERKTHHATRVEIGIEANLTQACGAEVY